MNLLGKAALVIGASGGIGSAIAIELAVKGADVVVHCKSNKIAANNLADQVRSLGRKVFVVEGDICDRDQVDALVSAAATKLGGIDILVNSAGIPEGIPRGTGSDWNIESWNYLLDVNATGKFLCIRAARSYLAKSHGVVVNVSSTSGYKPTYAYGVGKAAVNALTFWLSQLMAPEVRVVGVAPGYIEAGFNSGHSEEIRLKVADMSVLRRNGQAADVARAVAWLAGPEASFITGETLIVSGGLYQRL